MKNFSKLIVTQMIAAAILSNATAAFAQTVTTPANETAITATLEASLAQAAILNGIKSLKKDIETKGLPVEIAAATFSDLLIQNNVTVNDLDSFVKKNASAKDYADFRKMIETAKNASSEGEISSSEFGMIAAESLKSVDSKGLAWSGCAGLTAGVIVIIGAVAVGIIAIVKSAGDERIKAKHQQSRAAREDEYNRNVTRHQNRVGDIDKELAVLDGQINKNNQDIAYYQGLMVNEDDQAVRELYADKIRSLQDWNENARTSQHRLAEEQDLYRDPAYLELKIAQERTSYDADTQQSQKAEARALELAPANRALAKKLGIGAGIGAALGVYFVIDGSQDC